MQVSHYFTIGVPLKTRPGRAFGHTTENPKKVGLLFFAFYGHFVFLQILAKGSKYCT